jgi:hypothetical protein
MATALYSGRVIQLVRHSLKVITSYPQVSFRRPHAFSHMVPRDAPSSKPASGSSFAQTEPVALESELISPPDSSLMNSQATRALLSNKRRKRSGSNNIELCLFLVRILK